MQKTCQKHQSFIRISGSRKITSIRKRSRRFCTASDKRVEKIIINELEKSDYSILSEETG